MVRFAKLVMTGALSLLLVGPAFSAGKGGAGGAGGAGAGGAGAGGAGQSGAGQSGAGARGGSTAGGIGQTPWFSDQGIRSQLNLNEQQYNSLNKAYGEAYNQYNSARSGTGTGTSGTGADQQRSGAFNQSMNKAVDQYITDPQQRQRYNQLYLQYQGYGAFNDPQVQQKLNLTDEQRQKFNQLNQQWSQQMSGLGKDYQSDPQATSRRFDEMRKQSSNQINSILNSQQQQTWRQMTGDPYNFQSSSYFQNSSGSGNNNGQQKNKSGSGTNNQQNK